MGRLPTACRGLHSGTASRLSATGSSLSPLRGGAPWAAVCHRFAVDEVIRDPNSWLLDLGG
jgi:hypothetical protein